MKTQTDGRCRGHLRRCAAPGPTAALLAGWKRHPRKGAALAVAAALLLGISACASGGGYQGEGRGNPNLITTQEIAYWDQQGVRDLAHLVELARPRWLRTPPGRRSVYGSAYPVTVVFRDGRYLGGLQELRGFLTVGVRELRWLNAAEADALPGTGNRHVHGAIMVITTAGVGGG